MSNRATESGTSSLLTPARERVILWVLLAGNFVVGTGILLPAGMLSDLAQGLGVSVQKAGALVLISGVLVAVGAPLIAATTSRIDRRKLLVFSLALYAVAHVASALAPNYEVALAARALIAISAAIFTPQAASAVGALLPPARRAQAITMIFVGWSLSTVGGIPAGGYIAHAFGWRAAFMVVAALSVAAAIAVYAALPAGVCIAPLSGAAWKRVLTSPALMLVLLVTYLNGSGQFTFFTYVTPVLETTLHASAELATAILALYGVMAVIGNIVATRAVGSIGPARAATAALLLMACGMAMWSAGASVLPVVVAAAILWGLGTFAVNSVQQARLAAMAPELASASIALNTSAIYLGQATGAGLGGVLIAGGRLSWLSGTAATILLLAALISVLATRAASR